MSSVFCTVGAHGSSYDEQSITGRWLLVAIAALSLSSCNQVPTGSSEQFITLPSGKRAYCNRQGYHEARGTYSYGPNTLVTDPAGNFVPCDPRVGPPWDDVRSDAAGNLLAPEQIEQERQRRRDEAANSPAAQERARRAEAEAEAAQNAFIQTLNSNSLTCPSNVNDWNAWRAD